MEYVCAIYICTCNNSLTRAHPIGKFRDSETIPVSAIDRWQQHLPPPGRGRDYFKFKRRFIRPLIARIMLRTRRDTRERRPMGVGGK